MYLKLENLIYLWLFSPLKSNSMNTKNENIILGDILSDYHTVLTSALVFFSIQSFTFPINGHSSTT